MPTTVTFPSTTVNFALPLLFAGQSQKEFFVNESLSMIDGLLKKTVIGFQSEPPTGPSEGDAYVVASGTSEWLGRDDTIAIFITGAWRFIVPAEGTTLFDQTAGQIATFTDGWKTATQPVAPQNGTVIDVEARAALAELTQELKAVGIIG